jgi:two-component system, LytTR family, response regulator
MVINCVIVEDEPLAEEKLRNFISKVPFLKLLASFDNGREAIPFIEKNNAGLIFLDIQMDDLSGIQLLESLAVRPEVIITTAYERYALKGYELNVSDYLLKPYSFERFLQAVNKVHSFLMLDRPEPQPFIFIKTEHRLENVRLDDILFIEGMRDYRRIHTITKKLMTLQTFGDLEMNLPPRNFCRVHKSFLVALDKIEHIERERIRIKDQLIPISKTYKDEFFRRIGMAP